MAVLGSHQSIQSHCLWSQTCTCTCRIPECSDSQRGGCTCWCQLHTHHGLELEEAYLYLEEQNWATNVLPRSKCVYLTYTVIFAVDIFQIVALLALAVVAAKGVHTLSVVRAEVFPSYTFINIWRERKQEEFKGLWFNIHEIWMRELEKTQAYLYDTLLLRQYPLNEQKYATPWELLKQIQGTPFFNCGIPHGQK